MRKLTLILLCLLLLLLAAVGAALGTGVIHRSSLSMALNVALGFSGPEPSKSSVDQRYSVPPGFSLSLYAKDLPKARFLRFTPNGDLLLSRPHAGDVLLLKKDRDGDGHPDAIETLLEGLKRPQGMDFADNWLYVAESNRIVRARFDSSAGLITSPLEPVVEGLTDNGGHWSKTLGIGPDQLIYLSLGSTCNICEEEDPRRAAMMRFRLDGSHPEIIATGLRNSVGFDWAPWSGELYATDNGRDLLGDDFPPCELNRIEVGRFYGWPYFNGDNVPDPDMGTDPLADQRKPTAPVHGFRAHNAPLGITFPDTDGWPDEYRRSALVALHGSWNRSTPDGYKVVSLHWTDEGIVEKDFVSGFLKDGDISGRPVDVAQGPDGDIYISDDYAGAIYRVNRGGPSGPLIFNTVNKAQDETPPAWLEQADLEAMSGAGARLYRQYKCAGCHEHGTNAADLTNLRQRMGYNAVVEVLKSPRPPMPIFPLSEEQRRELAVYLLRND